jgi:hypothetical protein
MPVNFPGRNQRGPDPYAGFVHGENLTATEGQRQLEEREVSGKQRLAAARYWLREATDAVPIGTSGRRYLVDGREYRVAEKYLRPDEDPRSIGCEYYIVRADGVQFLRRPRGEDSGLRGLHEAARSWRVEGNTLVAADGSTQRLTQRRPR